MRVVLIGAGIGGLTAALSLHAVGHEAVVVEATQDLRPLGVGINLLPHAVGVLAGLGLADELAETGIPTAESVHFDRHGHRIWGEPRGLAAGHDWPQYSIHRGELQMLLLAAVRARLGAGAVRPGLVLTDVDSDSTGVRALVHQRGSGAAHTIRADALVGADGLHSRVRALLHPGEGAPRWNGIRMWRGVSAAAPFLTGRTMAVVGSNTATKLVVYPVSRQAERRSGALLNWVAEVRLPDDGSRAATADWNRVGRLTDVLPYLRDWRFDWLDVPTLLTGCSRILEYPMVDRQPLPFWSRGPVTLIGDAAHPMYPVGSNGGSQAILDARTLADELTGSVTATDGFAAYDRARREPVNSIVLANRDMPADRILHTVAERAPDGFDRIDDVLTADELAAIGSAYHRTSRTGTPHDTR